MERKELALTHSVLVDTLVEVEQNSMAARVSADYSEIDKEAYLTFWVKDKITKKNEVFLFIHV